MLPQRITWGEVFKRLNVDIPRIRRYASAFVFWVPMAYFVRNNGFTFVRVKDDGLEPTLFSGEVGVLFVSNGWFSKMYDKKSTGPQKGDCVLCNYPSKNDWFLARVRETEGHLISDIAKTGETRVEQVRQGSVAIEHQSSHEFGVMSHPASKTALRDANVLLPKQVPLSLLRGAVRYVCWPPSRIRAISSETAEVPT